VAAKSPAGLTQLFEQISGSEALKGQYETLQADVAKAEEKVGLWFLLEMHNIRCRTSLTPGVVGQACWLCACPLYIHQVAAAFARKKAIAAERKQKKEQKDEAERYLERQQELVGWEQGEGGREGERAHTGLCC
jgi:structural maintenance of chromosome 1